MSTTYANDDVTAQIQLESVIIIIIIMAKDKFRPRIGHEGSEGVEV